MHHHGRRMLAGTCALGLVALSGRSPADSASLQPRHAMTGLVGGAASLTVAPARALRDEPLSQFTISGLQPAQVVTLVATSTDMPGGRWTSRTDFVADADGAVDVARRAPAGGSYRGLADVMGPLWSMSTADKATEDKVMLGSIPMGQFTVRFQVLDVEGRALAEATVTRTSQREGEPVTRETWAPLGYQMSLYYPSNRRARQTVVHITGSGGGRLEAFCEMLAARGYFAACVPYFGEGNLPAQLVEIPLEFFATAIQQVLRHPAAVGRRVVFSGASRGGEGALLVGATYPRLVNGVLGLVPAAHVWEGEITPLTESKSAWTLNGAPLPHLPFDWTHFTTSNPTPPLRTTPTYRKSFTNASVETRAAARLPVGRIDGPVFLSSGVEDAVWESFRYADEIVATLRAARHSYPVVHYPGVRTGHLIINPAYTPVPRTIVSVFEGGGSIEDTARENAAMWRRLLEFLAAM